MTAADRNVQTQEVPAKVYRSDGRVVVAVPMPGLEPQDITVEVMDGPRVTVHGELRGTLKGEKDVLVDEWNPGPYHRELPLPEPVDGERANVTYNNGVLVVNLPSAEETRPATVTLEARSSTQGERVGHRGRQG
jgi:HSP20 family protein